MKKLTIVEGSSGEIIEDIEFSGGYNIQYASNEDSGRIQKVTRLDNAKFDEKHWIKNLIYRPICWKLVSKFEELKYIKPDKILFLEDINWTPTGGKKSWIARIKATNKELYSVTGYEYIIETREYYTEKMSKEQIVALMYHELRHIDSDGTLKDHDVEDWSNMVATLGKNWAETETNIADILDDEFLWDELRKDGRQVSIYDYIGRNKK